MAIKKVLIPLLLVFFVFSTVIVLARETTTTTPPLSEAVRSWASILGGWTILFFLLGGVLIFVGTVIRHFRPTWAKPTVIIGLLLIIIGVFGVEITYLMPYLGSPTISYQSCEQTFTTAQPPQSNLPDAIVDTLTMTACTISGYVPSELTTTGIVIFFIFGIIAPIGILMALFWEFTDFIYSKSARGVLTFLISLVAFRFLLASLFLDILGYGFAGLGILLIDYFIFMILFRLTSRMWKSYEEHIKTLEVGNKEIYRDYLRRMRGLEAEIATLPPDSPKWNRLNQEKRILKKRMDDFVKKHPEVKK